MVLFQQDTHYPDAHQEYNSINFPIFESLPKRYKVRAPIICLIIHSLRDLGGLGELGVRRTFSRAASVICRTEACRRIFLDEVADRKRVTPTTARNPLPKPIDLRLPQNPPQWTG